MLPLIVTDINKFDTNDFFHKMFFFVSMAGVVGMGFNSDSAFEHGGLGFFLSYVATRIHLSIMYIRAAFFIKRARVYCGVHLFAFFLSTTFFLLGTVIPGFATRITLWGLGSISEHIIKVAFLLFESWYWKPKYKTHLNIPEHLEHISERLGLLVIIVLGDVVGIQNVTVN
jgi:low temperature requirement protein LtrA